MRVPRALIQVAILLVLSTTLLIHPSPEVMALTIARQKHLITGPCLAALGSPTPLLSADI
jgi:hypothetical protein